MTKRYGLAKGGIIGFIGCIGIGNGGLGAINAAFGYGFGGTPCGGGGGIGWPGICGGGTPPGIGYGYISSATKICFQRSKFFLLLTVVLLQHG